MIWISVKSEVVEDKRQFKSDAKALSYLKAINKLHISHRLSMIGKQPKRKDYVKKVGRRTDFYTRNKQISAFKIALQDWQLALNTTLRLRVEIINSEHNQLNLI